MSNEQPVSYCKKEGQSINAYNQWDENIWHYYCKYGEEFVTHTSSTVTIRWIGDTCHVYNVFSGKQVGNVQIPEQIPEQIQKPIVFNEQDTPEYSLNHLNNSDNFWITWVLALVAVLISAAIVQYFK